VYRAVVSGQRVLVPDLTQQAVTERVFARDRDAVDIRDSLESAHETLLIASQLLVQIVLRGHGVQLGERLLLGFRGDEV